MVVWVSVCVFLLSPPPYLWLLFVPRTLGHQDTLTPGHWDNGGVWGAHLRNRVVIFINILAKKHNVCCDPYFDDRFDDYCMVFAVSQ